MEEAETAAEVRVVEAVVAVALVEVVWAMLKAMVAAAMVVK